MKTDCMPFTAIPHNSRLFLDFLFQFDKVRGFYVHRPKQEAVLEYARELDFPAERRAQVARVLERQNRAWGASAATLESIERLRQGAVACISGQQVSLLGGPLYSLLKAVSALEMAAQLTVQGCPAVPVFWLATEDHDLVEVAGLTLPNRCELEKLTTTAQTDSQAPVGRVPLPPEIAAVVERAGDAEFVELDGRNVADNRQVLRRRPQILTERQDIHAMLFEIAHHLENFLGHLTQPEH